MIALLNGNVGFDNAYAAENITDTDNDVPKTVTNIDTPNALKNERSVNTDWKLNQVKPLGKKLICKFAVDKALDKTFKNGSKHPSPINVNNT